MPSFSLFDITPTFINHSPNGLSIVSMDVFDKPLVDSILESTTLYLVPSTHPCAAQGLPVFINEVYHYLVKIMRGSDPLKRKLLLVKIDKSGGNVVIDFYNDLHFSKTGDSLSIGCDVDVRFFVCDYRGLRLFHNSKYFGSCDYPSLVKVKNVNVVKSLEQIRDDKYIRRSIGEIDMMLLCNMSSITEFRKSYDKESLFFYFSNSLDLSSIHNMFSPFGYFHSTRKQLSAIPRRFPTFPDTLPSCSHGNQNVVGEGSSPPYQHDNTRDSWADSRNVDILIENLNRDFIDIVIVYKKTTTNVSRPRDVIVI